MPPAHWQSLNTTARLLKPLAWLYALVWRLYALSYGWGIRKSVRMPVPVIVVGNVLAGGVGKTPLVIALVKHLQQRGYKVGIISRGYGRKDKNLQEVHRHSEVTMVGDEPLLLSHTTGSPVFVASARVQAAQALLAKYPQTQVIVSDDGLQHLPLAREIEIILFDERGTGNGLLLPAGPLREPWPRQRSFARTTLVLDHVGRSLAGFAINARGEKIPFSQLQHRTVHAVSAIAQPGRFFDMLRAQGLTLRSTRTYPDHDPLSHYSLPTDAQEEVLCTTKDAVKLWSRSPDVLAVPLSLDLDKHFLKAIDAGVAAFYEHSR